MNKITNNRTIVITGASSGIGEALAAYYAAPNIVLGLIGRDLERLSIAARMCEDKGAQVFTAQLNVTDRVALCQWLEDFDDKHSIDLVIANAGISAGTSGVLHGEPPEQVRHVFDVNLTGVLNTIEPLIPRMLARRSGQIALISSLAGFRGWPGAPAYCGSKAAVRVYGEALRGSLQDAGVRVNVICPGFVHSRMTLLNEFPMPLIMNAEKAAKIIAKGLRQNRGRIAFPLPSYLMTRLVSALPDFLAQILLRSAPSKASLK